MPTRYDAVVTDRSEAPGRAAAAVTGAALSLVVTAERAGWYKPDPRPHGTASPGRNPGQGARVLRMRAKDFGRAGWRARVSE